MPTRLDKDFNMVTLPARLAVSALPIPTIVLSEKGQVELANRLAFDLFGSQTINQHAQAVFRQPDLLSAINEALETRVGRVAKYATTVGQSNVTFDVHITPADDHLVLTFLDTSVANDLDAFRREFVANVSHELRTPLASLSGFIETLRGNARDDAAARDQFLTIMAREAERMSSLIDDLLMLSRVEELERKRPSTVVDLAALAQTTIEALLPVLNDAESVLTFSDNSHGTQVLADPDQLRQVIGNLVHNALRYGARKGRLFLSVSEPNYELRIQQAGVRLSLRDEGPGIASHHLPRLTERFYRIDSHRSRDGGGTGLGLAIVKHIVQRHRGHLLIESVVGKGSLFTVILPTLDT